MAYKAYMEEMQLQLTCITSRQTNTMVDVSSGLLASNQIRRDLKAILASTCFEGGSTAGASASASTAGASTYTSGASTCTAGTSTCTAVASTCTAGASASTAGACTCIPMVASTDYLLKHLVLLYAISCLFHWA